MYKDKKILGVITARGGSKGIPRKNIKELSGKPLIGYTIEAAKGSKYLTRCILSTDDQEIADVAKQFGCEVPFMRPPELATDTATSMSVIQHALMWLEENEGETYDYLMILQPTSPLRLPEDIDASIKKIVDTDADSVISVMEIPNFGPRKVHKIEDDLILPYFEEHEVGAQSQRRQDLTSAYRRNGAAIYLTKTALIKEGDLFGKISRPHLMPQERSVDIDEPIDFELAEFWINRRHRDA